MRPIDILLILLSGLIVLLVGFGPLFGSADPAANIKRECEMFYGPSGPLAEDDCVKEMIARSPTRPAR
ncbi:MAG: hypothetical protein JO305_07375 [Alphaproteobacteria bacterium]|nr:hypothetical protein [Alphaproteobacteria bacterium]